MKSSRVALYAAIAQFFVVVFAQRVFAQANAVEVYWQSTREINVAGTSDVIVLDQEIATAEVHGTAIRFAGVNPGETIALIRSDGVERALIVRVIPRPIMLRPKEFQSDPARGAGTTADDAQISRISGQTTVMFRNALNWSHQVGTDRLTINAAVDESTEARMHYFNLRGGSVDYVTPNLEVSGLDFSQDLTGDRPVGGGSFSYILSDNVALRGLRTSIVHDRDTFTVFAGTTIPFYFLTLRETRDVAGAAWNRRQSDTLAFFGATTFIRAPQRPDGPRVNSVMQSAGVHYAPRPHLTFDAIGGFSNRGTLARGYAGYTAQDWSAFASILQSSKTFPLNQLQSLFAGTESFRTGAAFGGNRRSSETLTYEHTVTDSGILSIGRAVSDYAGAGLTTRLTPGETASLNYTFSQSSGGFNKRTTTASLYSVSLASALPHGMSNSAQMRFGSVADPLGLQSQNEFALNESFSVPIRQGMLSFNYAHNRVNQSLIAKLNQELEVLSPELQKLFQENPAGFIASDLPPEIRDLLESQIPISDSISVALQRQFTPRLSASPNVTFTRSTFGTQRGWSHYLGYSLSYQMTPSLAVRSSLSSVWATSSLHTALQRSTIVTVGVQKAFNGLPVPFQALDRSRTIEGVVFRDGNVNGVFDAGEQGIEGIEVQLDGTMAMKTDHNGRYRFNGVSADSHRLSIQAAQFARAVRMTTLSEQMLDSSSRRRVTANFGLVDFARLMGNVFNDLRFEDKRRMDSVAIGDVHLLLAQNGRVVKRIVVAPDGTFEATDVVPGDYDLMVDTDTIPADYSLPHPRLPIRIEPVQTVSIDIPLRAMRSIAGHVYLKSDNSTVSRQLGRPTPALVPLAGVQVTVDHTIVTTDADGAFVLRNLPAGNLTVTLVPLHSLPVEMKVPAGPVHMPVEPVHVDGATIVITNPDLVPYLTNASTAVGTSSSPEQPQREKR